jgi:hypothetical protein
MDKTLEQLVEEFITVHDNLYRHNNGVSIQADFNNAIENLRKHINPKK